MNESIDNTVSLEVVMEVIKSQRNSAFDQVAVLRARIVDLDEQIEDLKSKLAELS